MSLTVLPPIDITPAMLVSSNLAEDSTSAWSSSATYGFGQKAHLVATHKVYQSLQPGNLNHLPSDPASAAWWDEVGPTNKWRAFDTSNSSQTANPGTISFVLAPGMAINGFAALNITNGLGLQAQMVDPVYGTVYDRSIDLTPLPPDSDWWSWWFGEREGPSFVTLTDLPAYPNAELHITLTGGPELAVGVVLISQARTVGQGVQQGARLGITDYSRKTTNEFGDTVFVERAFAKRATFDLVLLSNEVDRTHEFFASVRARPALYIGSPLYGASVIYGWFQSFEILIAYRNSATCQLQIEGLT